LKLLFKILIFHIFIFKNLNLFCILLNNLFFFHIIKDINNQHG